MSSAGTALKILVCGDVEGKIDQLFNRVSAVDKKNGPFEMLFCLGSFFGDDSSNWESYLKGEKSAPLTTYIMGPCSPEQEKYFSTSEGNDLCPNIIYLGKKGLFNGSSGLKVAYLSGQESETQERNASTFTVEEVLSIQEPLIEAGGFRGIDILLTSQWPRNVHKFAGTPEEIGETYGSEHVSQLALILKPRYHFSGLEGVHYERLPYRNHQILSERQRQATRFIALAKVANPKKKKWLYAFSVAPLVSMSQAELTKQPADVTECPYIFRPLKSVKQLKEEKYEQFFYDMESKNNNNRKRNNRGQDQRAPKQPRQHAQPQGPCWFCLASPEVEKHLVVSVGEAVYLALAKGALSGHHALILPIGHHQSTVELEPEVLDEVEKFKKSLKEFYKSHELSPVYYERNYKSSHLQIQVIPVPQVVASRVKEVFLDYAASQSIDLVEVPRRTDLKQIVNPGVPYFYVELESGEKLFHRIQRGGFPIQFGREVLVSGPLLNLPGKADWKSCSRSKEEETSMSASFRKQFEPFDFTL